MLVCISEAGRDLFERHVLNAQLAHGESGLVDTRCLCTRSQDIGFDGNVVGICYSFYFVKEAVEVSKAVMLRGKVRHTMVQSP